jgi:hypothetical protein
MAAVVPMKARRSDPINLIASGELWEAEALHRVPPGDRRDP